MESIDVENSEAMESAILSGETAVDDDDGDTDKLV